MLQQIKTIVRKLFKFWKLFLLLVIEALLITAICNQSKLVSFLREAPTSFFDNYFIEISAGILVSIIPLLIGIYFGKKIKAQEFHNNVEGVLTTLKRLREEKLLSQSVTRHIVKSIARNFGSEGLRDDVAEIILMQYRSGSNDKKTCKICDLKVEAKRGRCQHCKISAYAWDLD